jgi:hypothetical protein
MAVEAFDGVAQGGVACLPGQAGVDSVIAQAGGGGDERAGQYQLPSTSNVPWLLAWMVSCRRGSP